MRTWIAIPCGLLSIALSAAEVEDFDCSAAEDLVSLYQDGPDAVLAEIAEDPDYFVNDTIDDWQCAPDPLPGNARRAYVEKLICVYSDMDSNVSRSDLERAGRTFQRNIRDVVDCFEDEVLSEAPKTYVNETTGEAIILLLDKDISGGYDARGRRLNDGKVLLEYGYVRAEPGMPLYWSIEIGATFPRR